MVKGGRNSFGIIIGGENSSNVSRMMGETDGNVGVIPKENADSLRGKEFKNFDSFRQEFWKTVSKSSYVLHYKTPIQVVVY